MATRSTIGYFENGTLTAVYCHWDGYLSNNGALLFQNYNSMEKVKELVSLGNISSLGPVIGEKHPFDSYGMSVEEKQKFADFTTFYGRDRGETGQQSKEFSDFDSYFEHYNACGCEYFYVFSQGEWFYASDDDVMFGESKWNSLSTANLKKAA